MTDPREASWRADAALVYRSIRDDGPRDVVGLAMRLFPWETEGPESSLMAIHRASIRRVYDSVVWMRHHGVSIVVSPHPDGGSTVVLAAAAQGADSSSRPAQPPSPSEVGERPVTAKVSQDVLTQVDAPDGGGVMGVWHQSQR